MAYPFGMLVPNRHGSSNSYRYGFQGQEKDDELKGEGNSLNYTFRMHDPRVGRFFAVDPLESKYPFMTPFQFSSNSPIASIELEGLEGEDYRFNMWMTSQGGVQAQAVQAEKDMKMKITNGVFVEIISMPETFLDGISYLSTSLFQSIVGGFSYGFGDVIFDDGYRTRVDIPNIGFNWAEGFHTEDNNSNRGVVSFENGMRLFDGIGAVFTLGEINSLTRGASVKGLGKMITKEIPELSDDIAKTFMGGNYSGMTLQEDMILYRAGKEGSPLGQFFSVDPPKGVIQTRIDKAIPNVWPDGTESIIDTGFKIKIPKGTNIYYGEVAPQGSIFLGGTEQIFVPEPWNINGVEILESFPLK